MLRTRPEGAEPSFARGECGERGGPFSPYFLFKLSYSSASFRFCLQNDSYSVGQDGIVSGKRVPGLLGILFLEFGQFLLVVVPLLFQAVELMREKIDFAVRFDELD